MCTCEEDNNATEEYHTAFSELELPEDWRSEDWPPEDWRTSTAYVKEVEPTSTPRRPRRDYQRAPRLPSRTSRRLDLTTGVAIVPRRIDFDALTEIEREEDLGQIIRETSRTCPFESTAASKTYRSEQTQRSKTEQPPKMPRMATCGKCMHS